MADGTITIEAKLDVSRETAEDCLRLVEIYMNNHPDENIEVTRREDGRERYRLVAAPRLEYKKDFLKEASRELADALRASVKKELSND